MPDVKEALATSPMSTVHALISEAKWASYPSASQNAILGLAGNSRFALKRNVQLPNPNNPATTIPSVLIRFEA